MTHDGVPGGASVQPLCTLGGADRAVRPAAGRHVAGVVIPLIGVSTYVAEAAWGSWRAARCGAARVVLRTGRLGRRPPPSPAPARDGAGRARVRGRRGDRRPRRTGPDRRAATSIRPPTARRPRPEVGGVDPVRDGSERALLAAALDCRPAGARHLPGAPGPQRRPGRHPPPAPARSGRARRAPPRPVGLRRGEGDHDPRDSTAAAIFGAGATVLCSHHQSIDRLGTGLIATACGRRRSHRGGRAPRTARSSSGCSGIPRRAAISDPLPLWWRRPRTYRAARATAGELSLGRARDSSVLSHAKERGHEKW